MRECLEKHRNMPPSTEGHSMFRLVALAFLFATAAACQPAPVVADSRAGLSDIPVPSFRPWDGKPLPPPTSEGSTIYLHDHPLDAKHVWVIAVDANQITANLDLRAEQVAELLQLSFLPGTQATVARSDSQAGTASVGCQPINNCYAKVVKEPPRMTGGSGTEDPTSIKLPVLDFIQNRLSNNVDDSMWQVTELIAKPPM
jgi:hypothetical protein